MFTFSVFRYFFRWLFLVLVDFTFRDALHYYYTLLQKCRNTFLMISLHIFHRYVHIYYIISPIFHIFYFLFDNVISLDILLLYYFLFCFIELFLRETIWHSLPQLFHLLLIWLLWFLFSLFILLYSGTDRHISLTQYVASAGHWRMNRVYFTGMTRARY